MPTHRKENSLFYADLYEVYKSVVAEELHRPPCQRGRTRRVERFNGTLRPKVSRWVRKNCSFVKFLDALVASGGFAVYHYKLSLAVQPYRLGRGQARP